jgi:hypothetical protein
MRHLAGLCILSAFAVSSTWALPTMIRLGYPSCVSRHVSPQGGGLLNQYGRGVDQAQSLRGGEYQPWQNPFIEFLNADGRVNQDFRTVLQQQDASITGKAGTQLFRSRFFYRNVTLLGKGFRISAIVSGENTAVPRPSLLFDAPNKASQIFVNSALLTYRFLPTAEVSAGRDALPVGVNIADLNTFIRSRNRGGYYDVPTQAKLFWWGKRYQITGYGYAPGGNERAGQHESGGGLLAEYDLLGQGRTVVGANFLHGTATAVDCTLVGPYARLGFGRWGILAEHDITLRKFKADFVSFAQSTT